MAKASGASHSRFNYLYDNIIRSDIIRTKALRNMLILNFSSYDIRVQYIMRNNYEAF